MLQEVMMTSNGLFRSQQTDAILAFNLKTKMTESTSCEKLKDGPSVSMTSWCDFADMTWCRTLSALLLRPCVCDLHFNMADLLYSHQSTAHLQKRSPPTTTSNQLHR